MKITNLIWKIRFTLAVSWILRESWWEFKTLYLGLGWDAASRIDKELRKKTPYQAALDEITRWYTE